MNEDKKRLLLSLVFPAIFLGLIWVIKLVEIIFAIDLGFLGVYPLKASGLVGILTYPLIHGDLSHLAANSIPVFVLGFMIFYFYKDIAWKVILLIYFLSGIWVWFLARDAYHIGASGLIYGMAAFVFFSGVIRKDVKLISVSLVVIFLYGSMIWGVFPDFFPDRNISWEGHLMGGVAGLILAIYFRSEGPQRKRYEWEFEEEEEVGSGQLAVGIEGEQEVEVEVEVEPKNEEGPIGNGQLAIDSEKKNVVYHYKPKKKK